MQVRDRLTWILILIFLSCFIFASAPCVFTVPTFALLPALISQQLNGSPSFAILGLNKPFIKYIIAICESARWFSHRFLKWTPKWQVGIGLHSFLFSYSLLFMVLIMFSIFFCSTGHQASLSKVSVPSLCSLSFAFLFVFPFASISAIATLQPNMLVSLQRR